MHCPPQINPACLAKQHKTISDLSVTSRRKYTSDNACLDSNLPDFSRTRPRKALPVCSEETDKEAVTEKKRGGQIISASSLP